MTFVDDVRARLDPNTEFVEVTDDGVIILREKTSTKLPKPNMSEIGTTGMTQYGAAGREEYNSQLLGEAGRRTYNKMRRSDGQIRAVLRLVKTPVLAARWYIAPFSDKRRDQKIAEFVEWAMMKGTSSSFPQTLTEILVMLEFGFSAFEKVWTFKDSPAGTNKLTWQKLAMRHPMDVRRWEYDPQGGPSALVLNDQNAPSGEVTIEIGKLLAFTFEKEGGDMEGVSILRPAYKHWFYKDSLYKVDAIQKERHGIGIPVIKLPPGFDADDKKLAQEMGRNLRTNEKAHVVLPPGWELAMLKMEGRPVNALESVEHHDLLIVRSVLGQFLNAESATATQEALQTLFLKSTRYIAETIRDVFNKYAIPELVQFNFPNVEEYPELRVRRIGDTMDWRTVSFAIRNFIGSGVIIPDDRMETWIRDEMDLPPVEEATKRIIIEPLAEGEIPDGQPDGFPGPGDATTAEARANKGIGRSVRGNRAEVDQARVGLPRQSTGSNNRQGRSAGSNGRVGRDNSGR